MKEMNQKTPRKCFNFRGRERNRVLSGLGSGFQSGSDHLQSPSTSISWMSRLQLLGHARKGAFDKIKRENNLASRRNGRVK